MDPTEAASYAVEPCHGREGGIGRWCGIWLDNDDDGDNNWSEGEGEWERECCKWEE